MLSFPDLSRADLDADLNCGHWRDDGDSWRDRCWADASRDLLAALDGLSPITVTSGRWSVDVRPDRVYGFGVRFSAGGTGHFAGEACAHEGTGYSVECFGLVDKVSCIARFADHHEALAWVLRALSEKCRLNVSRRGLFDVSCTLEFSDDGQTWIERVKSVARYPRRRPQLAVYRNDVVAAPVAAGRSGGLPVNQRLAAARSGTTSV